MRDDQSRHYYVTEPLNCKLHDVLALLSVMHDRNTDPDLLLYVLRVTKHALAGIKAELDQSTDPRSSDIARDATAGKAKTGNPAS
jgi:hypothetical protein